eukprot:TRINITY_DN8702_c0_g1_i1.p2 TRINITY_DN8702_c0_g1~~TRINITY_DN8702_c0_g1_i1.p2  ORF type:complete len:151 (-),score=4.43 TRINITY_DN8702_c0_g1_i1:326-778(-)
MSSLYVQFDNSTGTFLQSHWRSRQSFSFNQFVVVAQKKKKKGSQFSRKVNKQQKHNKQKQQKVFHQPRKQISFLEDYTQEFKEVFGEKIILPATDQDILHKLRMIELTQERRQQYEAFLGQIQKEINVVIAGKKTERIAINLWYWILQIR